MIQRQLGGNRDLLILDEKGAGGAYHRYQVVINGSMVPKTAADIEFQKGPVQEIGWNGIQIEDLLVICEHRLQCFQAGPYPCRENALALTKIQEALHWLNHRTADRQDRNIERPQTPDGRRKVEGKSEP